MEQARSGSNPGKPFVLIADWRATDSWVIIIGGVAVTAIQSISNEPFLARNLFSHHFLKERLPIEDSRWRRYENENRLAFEKIKELYFQLKPADKEQYKRNEANLEKDFIRPVLDILGHSYDVGQSIYFEYRTVEKPDYILFPSEKVRQAVKGNGDDYTQAVIGLGEAKAWDVDLDKTTKIGPNKLANPSLQINNYLRDTNKP